MVAEVKDIDLGWEEIKKQIDLIDKSFTKVGIQTDAGNEEEGTSIAEIAFGNEYGIPERNVPERSFIRSTMHEQRNRINALTTKEYVKILKGKSTVKKSLGLIGEFVQAKIIRKIIDLRQPPNAKSTIAQKKSSNPLIDTGTMKNAVRHEEVIKGKTENGRV